MSQYVRVPVEAVETDVDVSASPTIGVVVVVVEREDEAAAAADTCRCRRRRRGPRRSEDDGAEDFLLPSADDVTADKKTRGDTVLPMVAGPPRGVNKRALLRMMAPPLMATNMMGEGEKLNHAVVARRVGVPSVGRVQCCNCCVCSATVLARGLTGRYCSTARHVVHHHKYRKDVALVVDCALFDFLSLDEEIPGRL